MTPQFKKNEYGCAQFFLAWLWHNTTNNSTFSTSLPLFEGVLTLHATSTHSQTLTWDCPLQAQVLSTIWCVPAMHEVALSHVHLNVCCYGLVLNTEEPMNTLYILIPLLLLKWQSLFRTLKVLSLQIHHVMIDFALIIGLITDDSWQNHLCKIQNFYSQLHVFLCTDLSSYKTDDCHLPLFLQWLTMLMFMFISFLFFYYTRRITSNYTFKSWHFRFMIKTGDEH